MKQFSGSMPIARRTRIHSATERLDNRDNESHPSICLTTTIKRLRRSYFHVPRRNRNTPAWLCPKKPLCDGWIIRLMLGSFECMPESFVSDSVYEKHLHGLSKLVMASAGAGGSGASGYSRAKPVSIPASRLAAHCVQKRNSVGRPDRTAGQETICCESACQRWRASRSAGPANTKVFGGRQGVGRFQRDCRSSG